MKNFIYLSVALLSIHLSCPASDTELKRDGDLVGLLNDASNLSLADAVAMESYMRKIRMWLMLRQELTREESFVEARRIIANRTADEIAHMAELIDRLEKNEQLAVALELDTSCALRHLDKALRENLGQGDIEDLDKSDTLVKHGLKQRAEVNLPKLRFREKNKK